MHTSYYHSNIFRISKHTHESSTMQLFYELNVFRLLRDENVLLWERVWFHETFCSYKNGVLKYLFFLTIAWIISTNHYESTKSLSLLNGTCVYFYVPFRPFIILTIICSNIYVFIQVHGKFNIWHIEGQHLLARWYSPHLDVYIVANVWK